jgi:hypothetical protein
MDPTEAARQLLRSLALPYGTVSILPWREEAGVVMHVMIDRAFIAKAEVPKSYEGYPVRVEVRQPAYAHST